MRERLALVRLDRGALPDDGPVTAEAYSLFKHGDARHAKAFGARLAECFRHSGRWDGRAPLHVTSSGFGAVAPAAFALVHPFAHVLSSPGPVNVFEVRRHGISAGDYARMTPGARRSAIGGGCMTVDVDLSGAHVVALDDICVTGTHEAAMDTCLMAAGARRVDHLYLVDARAYADRPTVESDLNVHAVPDVDRLLEVVRRREFVPNARVCRRVMQLPPLELARFVDGAPATVLAWMMRAVELDRLDRVAPYRAGVMAFRELVSSAAGATVSA